MAKLLAIAIKERKKAPMQLLTQANVSLQHGIANDFRGKPGKRQVTVLSKEAWLTACEEVDTELDWLVRRANLLVEGVVLHESIDKKLKIGDVELLITGETDPCKRMEQVKDGLFNALAKGWRGGVTCRVLTEGTIQLNDEVQLLAKIND